MSKQKWEVKSHSSGPDITGEYDGYWEVVNEKGDGLRTSEDYEEIDTDLQKIADALNSFEGKLSVETALEINLHCDNELLKMEIETLKAENSKMRQENDWAKIEDFALSNLPDYDQLVLWRDESGKYFCEMLDKDGNPWLEKPYRVTHWKKIVHPKDEQ